MDLNDIRQEYLQKPLNIEDYENQPTALLKLWFQDAMDTNVPLFNALTLSTISNDNYPNSRVVLAKEISDDGLVIYTDYQSQKGKEIENNNKVSLCVLWKPHDRQIRIKAVAKKIPEDRSKKYFQSRPKSSQISAIASQQSQGVDIEKLNAKVEELTLKYQQDDSLPCPKNWGGYFLEFQEIEFWQGRPNRLHDRFQFTKNDSGWSQSLRLSP